MRRVCVSILMWEVVISIPTYSSSLPSPHQWSYPSSSPLHHQLIYQPSYTREEEEAEGQYLGAVKQVDIDYIIKLFYIERMCS